MVYPCIVSRGLAWPVLPPRCCFGEAVARAKTEAVSMGTIVRAVCECGYAREMLCGGGMANFESVCMFPVYCRTCTVLESANLFDAPPRCPKCGTDHVIAYDHHELVRRSDGRSEARIRGSPEGGQLVERRFEPIDAIHQEFSAGGGVPVILAKTRLRPSSHGRQQTRPACDSGWPDRRGRPSIPFARIAGKTTSGGCPSRLGGSPGTTRSRSAQAAPLAQRQLVGEAK